MAGAPSVAIRGNGVAARASALMLGMREMDHAFEPVERSAAPVVLLSDPALALLRDCLGAPDLLSGKHRIARRVVAWGGQAPVAVEHGAIVLGERDLDAALAVEASPLPEAPVFTIHAAPPCPEAVLRRFGSRASGTAEVALRCDGDGDADACRVEAVAAGWLFLIPTGADAGWLLTVGGAPDVLLGQSRHIAPHIDRVRPSASVFETPPRMLETLAGPGWLACGTGAIAFDPICGDGTAQAVREAVLAAAVAQALAEGEDAEALATHYHSMLLAAMRRHLKLSAQFYATGGEGPWWRAQLAALAEGYEWCTAQLAMLPEPRYTLDGERLVARDSLL